jgi:hypothetical protein
MENSYRLKIKVGLHEFEAEGDRDTVQEQFKLWKELISITPTPPPPQPQIEPRPYELQPLPPPPKLDLAFTDTALDKIMKVDNRIVSMTIRPKTIEDAILLLLYGQKILRANDSVTGSEILDGLTATGGLSFGRIDRLLEKAGETGDAIVTGERRSKRYRLTNAGMSKARQLASDLIAIVA